MNGYKHDEVLEGGATYRIYQEYTSGTNINAVWSGHNIKEEALAAYNAIKNFFAPFVSSVNDASDNGK